MLHQNNLSNTGELIGKASPVDRYSIIVLRIIKTIVKKITTSWYCHPLINVITSYRLSETAFPLYLLMALTLFIQALYLLFFGLDDQFCD